MNATLSQLPFPLVDSEFALFEQLPFFLEDRVDDLPLPPTPSSICATCWEGPLPWYFGRPCVSPRGVQWDSRWPKPFSYLVSLEQLQSRADTGCEWCRFVLHMTCDHKLDKSNCLIVAVRGREQKRAGQRYQTLYVDINSVHCYEGYVYTAPDGPAAPYVKTRSPILDTGSHRALALAREHIDKCLHGHTRCESAASPGLRLPARLVDCAYLARPRLVATSEGDRGEYLALSYVWGGDQIHKTTKSNISTYEQGIPRSLLPATICDAIRVTHMLGFRFLWVDSLCIIQDSEEDKLHEIGRMHHIYRYAQLTIMAGSAEAVSDSFLTKRSPPEHDIAIPFIFLPYQPSSVGCWDDGSVSQSHVGQVYITSIPSTRRSYGDELGRMATRAWCLQEYLLSPRTLLFTPRTLLFRCLTATQAVGNDSPCFIIDDVQLPTMLFLQDPPAAGPDSKEWEDMHTAWMKVVEDYSHRTAGVESDKLVACAAVAEQFHRALGSEYLAGLWYSDAFLIDLLWSTVKDSPCGVRRQHTRPKAYRAPSWSWAAIDGVVSRGSIYPPDLDGPRTIALAEIVECRVTLEDNELPFGRITGGTLVLRGILIPCYCGVREPGSTSYRFTVSVRFTPLQNGFSRLTEIPEHLERLTNYLARRNQHVANLEDLISHIALESQHATVIVDCQDDDTSGRMWVVPFFGVDDVQDPTKNTVTGIGVLELEPTVNGSGSQSEKSRFRRVGILSATGEQSQWFHHIHREMKQGKWPLVDIEIV